MLHELGRDEEAEASIRQAHRRSSPSVLRRGQRPGGASLTQRKRDPDRAGAVRRGRAALAKALADLAAAGRELLLHRLRRCSIRASSSSPSGNRAGGRRISRGSRWRCWATRTAPADGRGADSRWRAALLAASSRGEPHAGAGARAERRAPRSPTSRRRRARPRDRRPGRQRARCRRGAPLALDSVLAALARARQVVLGQSADAACGGRSRAAPPPASGCRRSARGRRRIRCRSSSSARHPPTAAAAKRPRCSTARRLGRRTDVRCRQEAIGGDAAALREHHRALHHVAQLADVAGPSVATQAIPDASGRSPGAAHAQPLRRQRREPARERLDLRRALAQRRDLDR